MKIIKQWKNERFFTFRFISELLGMSIGHIQNNYYGHCGLGEEFTKKAKDIDRLLHLIDGEPSDLILLKYELSQLTGLSIEEIEKDRSKAEEKIERVGASIASPEEPTDLRKVTLQTLENLAKNGYKSAYRPNVSYDSKAVDAEIARKKFNIKRKKQIWEEKMALNA